MSTLVAAVLIALSVSVLLMIFSIGPLSNSTSVGSTVANHRAVANTTTTTTIASGLKMSKIKTNSNCLTGISTATYGIEFVDGQFTIRLDDRFSIQANRRLQSAQSPQSPQSPRYSPPHNCSQKGR